MHRSYGHTYALMNHPAIAPVGEARTNTDIFRALAQRIAGTADIFTLYGRASGSFKDPNVLGGFLILGVLYCMQMLMLGRTRWRIRVRLRRRRRSWRL